MFKHVYVIRKKKSQQVLTSWRVNSECGFSYTVDAKLALQNTQLSPKVPEKATNTID